MEVKDLRAKSDAELTVVLDELRRSLHELAFKAASKQLKNVHTISGVKRDIARVLTVLRERAQVSV
ncbi:MAG: 50S ribosomal protein L29 [Patescibacteria group bacterium]|jgi:large subunit ribosomal protein L29